MVGWVLVRQPVLAQRSEHNNPKMLGYVITTTGECVQIVSDASPVSDYGLRT